MYIQSHIDERPLEDGQFEQLFTRSLTGIYANNALTEAFEQVTMSILHRGEQEDYHHSDEKKTMLEDDATTDSSDIDNASDMDGL